MNRIWQLATVEKPTFAKLENDISTDVVIVGGGITGLTTALQLLNGGVSVTVLESSTIGAGDTGGSTGNLYATTSIGLAKVRHKWNDQVVCEMVNARNAALMYVENTIKRLSIPCQFQRLPLYRGIMQPNAALERQLEDEYEISKIAGLTAKLTQDVPLPIKLAKAMQLEQQAQFNPLDYVRALALEVKQLGGQIYEHSSVKEVSGSKHLLKTDNATIRADDIVLATHTPIGFNLLQTEMEPILEHGISARLKEGEPYPDGTFWLLDGLYSLRSYHYNGTGYLIAVGAKHVVGQTGYDDQYYQHLQEFVQRHYAVERFEHQWSAQQFKPADLLPYIGMAPMPGHVYVGTGYAADGLVWGTVAGMLIADQILERANPWAGLFDPQRFTPVKSAGAFLKQNAHVMKQYATTYLTPAQCKSVAEVPRGEGRIVAAKGEDLAVYRDQHDRLSIVSSLCTHMKCRLSWNGADKSWDCTCHGSRFAVDGQVIEGPAQIPLEKRKLPQPEEELSKQ